MTRTQALVIVAGIACGVVVGAAYGWFMSKML